MSAPLKVGVVGTGIFARDGHLPVYKQYPEKFQVTAAFNRTKAKALDFAKVANIPENKVFDDLDAILNDPEIDYIDGLLPVQFNVSLIKKSIAAGKPVILEKPIAANMEQAREIVKLADSTDLPIAIAENWLFLACIAEARKHLPRIGPVVSFTHNSTGPFVAKNKYLSTSWRQHPEHIGGFLSDGGVHQLALVTSLLGEFGSISALTHQVREESGADDISFATVRIRDSDVIGTFTYGSAFGATNKWVYLKIYGKNGSLLIELSDKANPVVKVRIGDCAEDSKDEEIYKIDQDFSFGVADEFLNFYEAVTKKDKSLLICTPRAAFHHLACVAAILESSSKKGDHMEVEKY